MNKQQLAARIWQSANKMRSKIEANEYKDYILGFIFYKFLSDKETRYLLDNGISRDELPTITEDNSDAVMLLQQDLGYFIAYGNLYETWRQSGRDFTVANVRDALSAFDRKVSPNHKKLFHNIFDTLQTGLSKLGASAGEQTAAIRELLDLIKDIPTDGRQDYDVLGFVYEYLISNFAANAGKKAGEFYTPHEVSVLMSDIIAHHLRHNDEIRIYDPTSGSGSLLINIGKSVSRHIQDKDKIKYYAQELKQNTYNLTRMNLIMRGINPSNIEVRNGDTLKEDWPYFDESDPQGTYDPLYVDAVVSNPPYSQEWDPTDQENDPRYAEFGIAPKKVADYAFLLHDLYHVKPDGIMTIVLPHGVLYRGGAEKEIRTALVEKNHIDAIIGLPEKVFFGTGISTIIMVLRRRPATQTDILFVDASLGFEKTGKNNVLRQCDIRKIADVVTMRKEIPDFSRIVSKQTVRDNDYNLNISRYVDSSPKAEHYDIYATMFGGIPRSEIDTLTPYWQAFPSLLSDLFSFNELGYAHLNVSGDVADHIRANADVQRFCQTYRNAFAGYHDYLHTALTQQMSGCNIQQKHSDLTADIFTRVEPFSPLVDKYQAFQFFSNDWRTIETDLEIIQTEGEEAFRQIEVDDTTGTEDGKLLPFDLVQRELLPDMLEEIKTLENALTANNEAVAELFDTLTAEEKDLYADDDNTAFAPKKLPKFKKGQIFDEGSIEQRLQKVTQLFAEEKNLKKQRTERQNALLDATRERIQHISLEDATALIDTKWTRPLCLSLERMPEEVIQTLTEKIRHLADKYATTYQDIANRINDAESRLYTLLGELQGGEADTLGLQQFRQTLNKH